MFGSTGEGPRATVGGHEQHQEMVTSDFQQDWKRCLGHAMPNFFVAHIRRTGKQNYCLE